MGFRHAAAVCAVAALTVGCSSFGGAWIENSRQQYRRAVDEIKADVSVLDSENDGLDAFSPSDAKLLRAARAEMSQ